MAESERDERQEEEWAQKYGSTTGRHRNVTGVRRLMGKEVMRYDGLVVYKRRE
jgi:hypothetical protein